jgi:hypothetical protein
MNDAEYRIALQTAILRSRIVNDPVGVELKVISPGVSRKNYRPCAARGRA